MLNLFRNFLTPPISDDEEKNRLGGLLQNAVMAMWIFPVLDIIIAIISPKTTPVLMFSFIVLTILLLTLSVMLRRGLVQAGSILLIASLVLLGVYVNYQSGGENYAFFVVLLSIVLMGALLLGPRGGILTFIATITQIGILSWAGATGRIHNATANNSPLIDFLVTIFGYLLGLIIFQLAASSLSNALKISRAREKEVQALSEALDLRVQERTAELNRRSEQLESAALVTRAAAEIRDLRELLEKVVQQITERFNFYHAGIFLTDINAQFVILQAASSEGGKRMIERGHRLEIGRQGIVGFAAYQKHPRIAQDVGADAVFFNNPDLPETHSEVALPLVAQNQLIGVLDIQSLERNAFSDEDIHTLQTMADQIALAIENTRLFEQSRSAIQELQVVTAENTLRLWKERLGKQSKGYAYSSLGVLPLSTEEGTEHSKTQSGEHVIKFPIALRGQQIGVLSLKRKSSDSSWTESEQEMASKIAGQVALAIENARLLEDSQLRASRERTIGEVATRITSSINIENILRTTVQELGRMVPDSEVIVQLQEEQNGHK